MKTNSAFLSRNSCFLFFLTFYVSTYVVAQERVPKNYIGVSGIGELTRIAVSAGIDYERWLFTKNQFAIGAKAEYTIPSRTINYIFSSNESLQRNRQIQLMGTSYFFTNSERETRGFFLSFGAGINFIKWEMEAYDASGNKYIRTVHQRSPGFDISFGGQFSADPMAVRVTSGLQSFPAAKYKDYVNGNGIVLIYLKVSTGF